MSVHFCLPVSAGPLTINLIKQKIEEWSIIMVAGFRSMGGEQKLVKIPIDASKGLKPCLRPPEAAAFITLHNSEELTEEKVAQVNVPCVRIFQPHKCSATW